MNELKELFVFWSNYTQVHEFKGMLVLVVAVFVVREIIGFFLKTETLVEKLESIIKQLDKIERKIKP